MKVYGCRELGPFQEFSVFYWKLLIDFEIVLIVFVDEK